MPRLVQGTAYYCSTRTYTASGVREGVIPLSFPPEARAHNGSTMVFRYRRQTPVGAPTYTAECVIPRTMSALELANRRFRVPPELRSPKGRDRDGNEITTQRCVGDEENGCTLEPVVVVV
ncbi:MAG TPA: hypothetical protein VHG51_20675, partial [Longimicrobiaceae bacterium]|nr:hypothetical protein [Longimicrobiaceae bacterium]